MATNHDYYIHDDYQGGKKRGMGTGSWIAIGILAVLIISLISFVGSCVGTYNNLVEMEENVNHKFANVQTQMQSRIEKIPDLVKVADEAAKHLENIYEDIAMGRQSVSNAKTPEELDAANAQVDEMMNNVINVIHENYPTVTASEQYTSLMDSIEGAANRIAVAREDYNEAVSTYNKAVRRFPGSLLAGMFGFERMEGFKASDAANQDSVVDFGD